MLKIESFYLNNKPFIFKSIFMISKKGGYVFMRKNGSYIAWDHASSEKDVNNTCLINSWEHAREIQPKIKLSQSELIEIAAAAKGVSTDQIEIA